MNWYHWLTIITAGICVSSLFVHFRKLIQAGAPKDYSHKRGDLKSSIRYSMTGAMSPKKKESAFLYLPTYTAGMLYHLGTFLSLFLVILLAIGLYPNGLFSYIIAGFLFLTTLSGLGILIKRILKTELRKLSNPDDYISNIIVTLFQLTTAFLILKPGAEALYYVVLSLVFLYIPVGKLKHTIYFFAARYQLGFFYGWRATWPPKGK